MVQRAAAQELACAGFAVSGDWRIRRRPRDDVTATLQAAIADPEVAARTLSRLSKPRSGQGFGDFGAPSAVMTHAGPDTGSASRRSPSSPKGKQPPPTSPRSRRPDATATPPHPTWLPHRTAHDDAHSDRMPGQGDDRTTALAENCLRRSLPPSATSRLPRLSLHRRAAIGKKQRRARWRMLKPLWRRLIRVAEQLTGG